VTTVLGGEYPGGSDGEDINAVDESVELRLALLTVSVDSSRLRRISMQPS
jgi:hypothetical protein